MPLQVSLKETLSYTRTLETHQLQDKGTRSTLATHAKGIFRGIQPFGGNVRTLLSSDSQAWTEANRTELIIPKHMSRGSIK